MDRHDGPGPHQSAAGESAVGRAEHAAVAVHLRWQNRQRIRPASADVLPAEAVYPAQLRSGFHAGVEQGSRL